MKIKIDFITNSSSTSYLFDKFKFEEDEVAGFDEIIKTIKKLEEAGDKKLARVLRAFVVALKEDL